MAMSGCHFSYSQTHGLELGFPDGYVLDAVARLLPQPIDKSRHLRSQCMTCGIHRKVPLCSHHVMCRKQSNQTTISKIGSRHDGAFQGFEEAVWFKLLWPLLIAQLVACSS